MGYYPAGQYTRSCRTVLQLPSATTGDGMVLHSKNGHFAFAFRLGAYATDVRFGLTGLAAASPYVAALIRIRHE